MERDETMVSTGGETMAAPSGSSAPGAIQHANFTHERELARGGMGRVVVAHDVRLDRTVALKTLQTSSETTRMRFEREARITARLQHPGIVPIYESGTLASGEPFYAMRLVAGTPLDREIAGKRDLRERLGLLASATAVAEALAYAHDQRIVHRDLKPANVLVGKFGETVVIDWGLAKDLTRDETSLPAPAASPADTTDTAVTLDGEIMGTPSYMPPEQAIGDRVDERADVYALGALLYHVIAGRPPYRGSTMVEILAAVTKGPPVPLAAVEPNVPPDLATIVARAMERDPSKRYATAGELAAELRGFVSGQLVASHRYSTWTLVRRWLRRNRAAVGVAIGTLVLIVFGVAFFLDQKDRRERDVRRELARSRLELGRQLAVEGREAEAAPYLRAALADLPDDPVARDLSARAGTNLARKVATLHGRAIAITPDGSRLAIGRGNGDVEVVDTATGELVETHQQMSPTPILRVDISPNGKDVTAVGIGNVYTSAKVMTGRRIATAGTRGIQFGDAVLPDAAMALAATADRTQLGAALTDGGALVWSGSGEPTYLRVPGRRIMGMWFDDRNRAITLDDEAVRRWDGLTPTTLAVDAEVSDVLALGGDRVVIAHGGFGTGAKLVGTTAAPRDLAGETIFSSVARLGDTRFVSAGEDGAVRVWDLAHPRHPVLALDATGGVDRVIAAGERAATIGLVQPESDAEVAIDVWNLHDLAIARPVAKTPSPIAKIAMAPDRVHTAVWLHGGDKDTDKEDIGILAGDRLLAEVPGWPAGIRGDSEVVDIIDGRVELYSALDGSHLRTVTDSADIRDVGWSKDGKVIATTTALTVTLRDATWRATVTMPLPTGAPVAVVLVTDDGRLVTGHDDGTIRIWRGNEPGPPLSGHTGVVANLQLRGDTLLSTGYDLTLRAWSFPGGESRGIVARFTSTVDELAVSPDGRRFATASHRNAVDVWDASRGVLLATIPTTDDLLSVTFADDAHLLVGGIGGSLEIVDVPTAGATPSDDLSRALARSRWDLVDGRLVAR